jgi:hypothetical protein
MILMIVCLSEQSWLGPCVVGLSLRLGHSCYNTCDRSQDRPVADSDDWRLSAGITRGCARHGQMIAARLKNAWQITAGIRLPLRRRSSPAIAPRINAAAAV